MSNLIIQINDTMRIRRTNMSNLVIEQLRPGKGVKWRWATEGYYSRISQVLPSIPDHLIMHPDIQTMKDLQEQWEQIIKNFRG